MTARRWCQRHDCWDDKCPDATMHRYVEHRHAPWFARLRDRIFGRSRTDQSGSKGPSHFGRTDAP